VKLEDYLSRASLVLALLLAPSSLSVAQKPAVVCKQTISDRSPTPSATKGFPQLTDITTPTQIHFGQLASPDQRYIIESMGGGVALLDDEGDGWSDIYFTNGPSVAMLLAGKRAKSALYRNNHDGTFSDATDRAGVGLLCWAMGIAAEDYNNDGHPDLFVNCFGGIVPQKYPLAIMTAMDTSTSPSRITSTSI